MRGLRLHEHGLDVVAPAVLAENRHERELRDQFRRRTEDQPRLQRQRRRLPRTAPDRDADGAHPPLRDRTQRDGDGLAVEEVQPKVKPPSLYRVVLINDDFTPMEFVVDILESIFSMERTRATQVMLEVHTKGKGICGVFNYEIAETKVAQVMTTATQHQHPLLCTMEES